MEKHLLFFDIDKTLYYRGRCPFRVVRAVKRAQRAGHYCILNTGRSKYGLPKNLLRQIKWDGFVCAGSYVEFLGEALRCELMPYQSVKTMIEILMREKVPAIVFDCDGPSYSFRHKYFGIPIEKPEDILVDFDKKRVNKLEVMASLSPSVIEELKPYAAPYDMGTYADIFVRGCSKATGMEVIGKKTGIPRERMIAFGDNNNDLDMLKYAGKSVAMKKASPDAIEAATFHATKHKLGVVQGIQKYLGL